MSKLMWAQAKDRSFEAGVDKGVLFVPGKAGVAWSGIISISESPSGGEPKPYYIDGYKFQNISALEEFNATIEAYGSPEEFKECDGTKAIRLGLYATQQPRKSFGLSYRTLIGGQDEGLDQGYKIHLVYNALATPSERANETISNEPNPLVYSWDLSTVAPIFPGFRPTSHYVIDSRTTPELVLKDIERALYGTVMTNSYLPSITQIVAFYDSYEE